MLLKQETSLRQKQHSNKSRILPFKYFINAFINIYRHDNITAKKFKDRNLSCDNTKISWFGLLLNSLLWFTRLCILAVMTGDL